MLNKLLLLLLFFEGKYCNPIKAILTTYNSHSIQPVSLNLTTGYVMVFT